MKTTKNNLITIIVLGIVIASCLIGAIAVTSFRTVVDENNQEILFHYCKENAETMNNRFSEIETLTHTLSDYYLEQLESPEILQNDRFLVDYTKEMGKIAFSIIRNNPSVVAIYFRMNPEITNPTAGFFISRTAVSSIPEFKEPTDLSKYDSSDVQSVGWYHIPVETGKALWLEPYENPHNGIYMISYVKPLYIGDTLVGVVGMDLDYNSICEEVGGISLYDSGYAILMDQSGRILYAGDHDPVIPGDIVDSILGENQAYVYSSYIQGQQLNITVSHKLRNGEYLVLIVPEGEIYNTRNQMIFTIILIAIAVSTTVILVLTGMINRIMNVARTDKLTGAKNRNAYLERVGALDGEIQGGKRISFALLVFDINGLKTVNDTIGHAVGDKLIVNSYKAIKSKFAGKDVFRIGGDEFVIIMEKPTAPIAQRLVSEFREIMAKKCENPDEASVSCGYALFHPKTDTSCEDVFNRADRDMYEDKERFYASNPGRSRRV